MLARSPLRLYVLPFTYAEHGFVVLPSFGAGGGRDVLT